MKLLLVDQDPRVQISLKRILSDEFVVDIAKCAKDAEQMVFASHYDLLIMDIVMPDMDGDVFINLIRSYVGEIPIIVISNKNTVSDKDFAFQKGADDYLVKPVNNIELKARIKALLRRAPINREFLPVLSLRKLFLDRNKKMAYYEEQRLRLRKKEMQLLEFFLVNKGRVLTRMEILENVWEADASPFTNTVEVHLKRLRDKIEKPFGEQFIQTIHGIGYLME
jgi:DNA-binding response OmpR family regulator